MEAKSHPEMVNGNGSNRRTACRRTGTADQMPMAIKPGLDEFCLLKSRQVSSSETSRQRLTTVISCSCAHGFCFRSRLGRMTTIEILLLLPFQVLSSRVESPSHASQSAVARLGTSSSPSISLQDVSKGDLVWVSSLSMYTK